MFRETGRKVEGSYYIIKMLNLNLSFDESRGHVELRQLIRARFEKQNKKIEHSLKSHCLNECAIFFVCNSLSLKTLIIHM